MWRRTICSQLKTLSLRRSAAAVNRSLVPPPVSAHVFSRCFSAESVDSAVTKRVEDVTPIKTGHEGKDIRNIYEHHAAKKEAPVVVESYYDRRLIGCSHGYDCGCIYFWLFKGKPDKCPGCEQYFELDVVGPGRPPP